MFKHAQTGQVSVYPMYASPIFSPKEIKNKNIHLVCLFPGPQQTRVEMFMELYYRELQDLSECFLEVLDGESFYFKIIFVLKSCDYKGLPDFTQHKGLPSTHACAGLWERGLLFLLQKEIPRNKLQR